MRTDNRSHQDPERINYYCGEIGLRKTRVIPEQNKILETGLINRPKQMIDLYIFNNLFFEDSFFVRVIVNLGNRDRHWKPLGLDAAVKEAIGRHRHGK